MENNVTLHTLILSGNPGYNLEIGITLDATAAAAQQKMQETLKAGVNDSFGKSDTTKKFNMVNVLQKWKNEKDAPVVQRVRSEAVEITAENPALLCLSEVWIR